MVAAHRQGDHGKLGALFCLGADYALLFGRRIGGPGSLLRHCNAARAVRPVSLAEATNCCQCGSLSGDSDSVPTEDLPGVPVAQPVNEMAVVVIVLEPAGVEAWAVRRPSSLCDRFHQESPMDRSKRWFSGHSSSGTAHRRSLAPAWRVELRGVATGSR